MGSRLELPPHFRSVRYSGLRPPGAPGDGGLEGGANCQHFAFELVRHFGLALPDFRSSSSLGDTDSTEHVGTEYLPLDLLLWNRTGAAYGAHVGVYLGDRRAVHLSKRVGFPAVWPLAAFRQFLEYRVFIGAKRVRRAR